MQRLLSLLAVGLLVMIVEARGDIVPPPERFEERAGEGNAFGRAVQLERWITTSTGLAISPLLGMGVLGGVEWFRATPEERAALPWYTTPWVWGTALGIFLLATAKDTIGVVVPEALKKPLTVLEVLEDKLSAVIVAFAVLPSAVAASFPEAWGAPGSGGGPVPAVVAMPLVAVPLLLMGLLVGIFGVVFLVSHACKCLLLLSPSSFVTAALKGAKGAFLLAFAGTAVVAPWAGLALSVVVIVGCLFISGWAFRWNVFGWWFVWDFLGSRFDVPLAEDEPLTGFATSRTPGVKARTYGVLRREGTEWVFRYRPWLVGPWQEARWKALRTGLRTGLLAPALTARWPDREGFVTILDFRLRFRGHGDALERRLGVDERQPSRVVQGLQQTWAWVREQSGLGAGAGGEATAP